MPRYFISNKNLFIFLALISFCAKAQTFQNTYGETGNDDGYAIQQTADGGYITVGTTNSTNMALAGNEDIVVIKYNSSGNIAWAKTYGGEGNDEGRYIQQTADLGYIILGNTNSTNMIPSSEAQDVILIKTDNSGNVTWAGAYGANVNQDAGQVKQTDDGGFIVIIKWSNSDYALFKVTPSGSLAWAVGPCEQEAQVYAFGSAVSSSPSVEQTDDDGDGIKDDGFIISGGINQAIGLVAIKTNSVGGVGGVCAPGTWAKKYGIAGTTTQHGARSIKQVDDDGDGQKDDDFVFVGNTPNGSPGAGGTDVFFVKLNESDGSIDWSYTYGGTGSEQFINYVEQTTDNGFIIVGNTKSTEFTAGNNTSEDMFMIKTSSAGSYLWSKTYGGTGVDLPRYAKQTTDGGYILFGNTTSLGNGGTDFYMVKADANGNTDLCAENNPATQSFYQTTTQSIPISGSFSSAGSPINSYTVTSSLNTFDVSANMIITPICIMADFSNTTVCLGNATSFTSTISGTPPYTYSWDFGDGSALDNNANPLHTYSVSGSYTVVLTASNNVSNNVVTKLVVVHPLANIQTNISNLNACLGDTIEMSATGGGNYLWSPGLFLGNTSGAMITCFPTLAGIYSYSVSGTDNNACPGTAFFSITVNSLPTINGSENKTVCDGSSTVLIASGASEYSWEPLQFISPHTGAQVTVTPTLSGSYSYTITGTDVAGCMNTKIILINVLPVPTISVSENSTTCIASSTTLTAQSTENNYVWTPGPELNNSTGNSVIYIPSLAGTFIYTVTSTGSNNCSGHAFAVVDVLSVLPVNAGADVSVCQGNSIILSATGAPILSWSPGTNPSIGPVVEVAPVTSSSYTVSGALGYCTGSDVVTVTVLGLPTITVTGDLSICEGDVAIFNASGADKYLWQPAYDISSSNNGAITSTSPSSSINYTITGTDANNCSHTITFLLEVGPLPMINAGNDITIYVGEYATLYATGAFSYIWESSDLISCNSCSTILVNPSSTTSYSLTGTDNNGCTASDMVTIFTLISCTDPYIPSAFSPNNDGQNDVLFVENRQCNYSGFSIEIYDRWGGKVFKSTDMNIGWDGLSNNNEIPTGVYFYRLNTGLYGLQKGNITLVR